MDTSYGWGERRDECRSGRRLARAAVAAGVVWAVLLGATACSVAWAGAYHVFACRMPDGLIAPVDGWSGSSILANDEISDSCASGGGLVAALKTGHTHPADKDLVTWTFSAPAGETLGAATLWRAGDTLGGSNEHATYLFWLSGSPGAESGARVFEKCTASAGCQSKGSATDQLAAENRVEVPESALHTPNISLTASCGSPFIEYGCPPGGGDENGNAAIVELFAADLILDQESSPTVGEVSGSLAEAPTVSGTADVAFTATDPGSGVYQALFQVDGATVSSPVLNANGGRCHDVGQTTDGLSAFLYTQPCKPSLSEDVPFDTTSLSDGPHHLVVSVTDAAGNATPVVDRQVAVANAPAGASASPSPSRGPANGSEASEQATLTASWKGVRGAGIHVTSAFGAAHAVQGRLTTAGGHPIAGAQIDVSLLPAAAGAHPLALPAARTGPDGSFALTLPRTVPGGALRLGYRSHLGDTLPVATRTLTLSVRAGLRLRISPTVSAVGRTIRFSGRLRGGPLPPGGKQLVLEARSPGGRWIEFNVIRSNPRGDFHASYRFRFPGPASYSFRVVSNQEADYPYLAGASNVVGVRER
jgi:hypothetical protein